MKQPQTNIPFKAPESGNAPAAVKKILDVAYSSCRLEWTKDNPDDMDNANNKTKCAKIAWGAVENAGWKKKADGTWHKQPDTNSRIAVNQYAIKKSKYDGVEHIIVPVVMMTEGVRSGSDGPILHSSEELAHIVASWNGIPVVINHPQNNEGMYISANEPTVQNVGKIFNTKFEDGKLKAEAWINPNKLKSVSTEALAYLNNQQPLEVSVGVFTDTEYKEGEFQGITYNGIARNYRPDHLALLPGGVGACSWEDGCGIRVNSLQDNGGKGSGNFGHGGRPGEVGGSGDSARSSAFQEAGMDREAANDLAFGIDRLLKGGYMDIEDAQYIEKLVKKGKYDLATKMINDAYSDALSNNEQTLELTPKLSAMLFHLQSINKYNDADMVRIANMIVNGKYQTALSIVQADYNYHLSNDSIEANGGKGSGNFGHTGIPGHRGGSGSGSGSGSGGKMFGDDNDRSTYYEGAELIGEYKNWEYIEYPVVELPGLPGNYTTPDDTATISKYFPASLSKGYRVAIVEQNNGHVIAEGFKDAEWADAWAKRNHPSSKKKFKSKTK